MEVVEWFAFNNRVGSLWKPLTSVSVLTGFCLFLSHLWL